MAGKNENWIETEEDSFKKDKSVTRGAPIERHSQKPEEARIRLERLFGDVRRVELFARSRRPGWDVWGNQVEGSITL